MYIEHSVGNLSNLQEALLLTPNKTNNWRCALSRDSVPFLNSCNIDSVSFFISLLVLFVTVSGNA